MKKIDINANRVTFNDNGAVLQPVNIDALPADKILVKSRCSSISTGTELSLYIKKWNTKPGVNYSKERIGGLWDMHKARENPGYALAGDVIDVGENVKDFKVGDRVISTEGHADYAVCSTEPWKTLKIPDGVSYEEASFVVLGSVALHGIRRARLQLGEDIVIMGAGVVGLFALQFAKMCGASPVMMVDLDDSRLELAGKLGADYTVNPIREDLVESIKKNICPDGVICTLEATGNPKVLQTSLRISRVGGRIVVVGAVIGEVTLDMFNDFMTKELQMIAAQQPVNPTHETPYYRFTKQKCRKMILDMIRDKKINVKDFITHKYHYSKVPEVYEMLGKAKSGDYRGSSINRDMIGVTIDWND